MEVGCKVTRAWSPNSSLSYELAMLGKPATLWLDFPHLKNGAIPLQIRWVYVQEILSIAWVLGFFFFFSFFVLFCFVKYSLLTMRIESLKEIRISQIKLKQLLGSVLFCTITFHSCCDPKELYKWENKLYLGGLLQALMIKWYDDFPWSFPDMCSDPSRIP